MPRLCALVTYYPSTIPLPKSTYPSNVELVVHLAAAQSFAPVFKYHLYPDVAPGFAEYNNVNFDKLSASLSWTRSLGALRKAMHIEVDLESIWEDHVRCQ